MRRLGLLAPGAVAPWTEGRKIFVADLADVLKARGIDVQIFDGSPAASPGMMIVRALFDLKRACQGPDAVDAVAAFPYGTFNGIRGWVNASLLRRARAICSAHRVRYIPVFYSCAGMALDRLGSQFGPALAVGRGGPDLGQIHLGIRHPELNWRATHTHITRLLFLCGYQKPTARALHDVLFERGLVDLLDAGDALANDGIRLTVAIPFLRDVWMRERLSKEIASRCPALIVDMEGEVDSHAIFQRHDVFAFPYRNEHSIFIPTSLLEAMSSAIPVLAADHAMYRSLTVTSRGPLCSLHKIGDPADLCRVLHSMKRDYALAIGRAINASAEVRADWTIENAVDELIAAIDAQEG